MKIIRPSRFVSLLAVLALILAGCSGNLFNTPEPVEFTFTFPGSDQAFYEPLLQAYQEQHPGHTVIARPVRGDGNTEGDVVVVAMFEELADEPAYRYLDEILVEEENLDQADWYPGALEAFREGGKMYAVPYGLDPFVLFYNQALVERLGVPAPQAGWSWEDFLALAEAMTLPEEEIYGYAPLLGYDQDAMMFIYQRGGRLIDQDGRPTLEEPATIAALDWYGRLYTQYEVGYPYSQNQQGVYRALMGGKVGMWMMPFSMRSPGREDSFGLDYPIGVTLLPASAQQTTIALFEGYAISSKAENPQACWMFIRFLLDHPNPRLVPARRSLAESEAYRDLVGEEAAQIGEQAVSRALQISRSQLAAFEKVSPLFQKALAQVLSGQMTADQALEEAQRLAEEE
jgi:multiple sugar transport system substrate-binding protein